jgi:hypothetical protein
MKIDDLRQFALSLPDATEQPHFDYSSFRVRGKIFVTVSPDEKYIHVFLPEADREQALALHQAFAEKLVWGGKTPGLRILMSKASPTAVRRLVRLAWLHKAPKRLTAALNEPST